MTNSEQPAVLTILGSGTALPSSDHRSAAHHLHLPHASVLLDCGSGTLHGLSEHGIDWVSLTHVAVSHYHNDHVGDLGAILFALKQVAPARTLPLTLIGPRGFRGFLERLAAALGPHVLEPGFRVTVREVGPGDGYRDSGAGLTLSACPTPHTDESLAYRLRGAWGAVGYTGDTGHSLEVARFLAGCRVVVAECALADPPQMEGHLSPRLVAELAAVARPELLVLTHVYPDQTPEEAELGVSRRYDGRVVAAWDGMRVALARDGLTVDPNPKAV